MSVAANKGFNDCFCWTAPVVVGSAIVGEVGIFVWKVIWVKMLVVVVCQKIANGPTTSDCCNCWLTGNCECF